jgi:hypothetical protein
LVPQIRWRGAVERIMQVLNRKMVQGQRSMGPLTVAMVLGWNLMSEC